MTPDEQIAVIRAKAEGKKIEENHQMTAGEDWNPMCGDFDFTRYNYRIAPSPIASGHNPDKLTVEQVGEGKRTLSVEERKYLKSLCDSGKREETYIDVLEWWNNGSWINGGCGCFINKTFRTQKPEGYFLPKKVVKVEGWMNVYGENWFAIHNTKNRADTHADSNRIACKHIVFEVEDGEGLEQTQ